MARRLRLALEAGSLVGAWLFGTAPASFAQMATADRIQSPGWWPTKGTASRQDYVGADRCARCHAARATQTTTSMARTAQRATDSDILRARERLNFRAGSYSYAISSDGQQSVYSVSDGTRSLSAALGWAFGVGTIGQTYVFERQGTFYESRVSYYDALRALDFTPKRALIAPRDVEEAIGRALSAVETRRCFGCHTTASTTASGFDPAALIPGVACEACHGPGREHVTAMERRAAQVAGEAASAPERETITNPRKLDPVDSVDFCGACHATFWDVKLAGEGGIAALRSQPHRLQSSRCWGEGDARLTCIACHDPHKPLVRDSLSYDRRCLSCHVAAGAKPTPSRPGQACNVATQNCVSCHMPKYDVPEMHFKFTDHWIRIVSRKDAGATAPGERR